LFKTNLPIQKAALHHGPHPCLREFFIVNHTADHYITYV
jgi:hypothetical protein